ncbi:MAG: ABC transporter permease [Pirellulales bacterium]
MSMPWQLGELEPDALHASPPGLSRRPLTTIGPSSGWQLLNVRELWQFRELLFFLTWRDVKVRYKQTLLGATWALLQPLMMMVVFTIFFHKKAGIPSGELPYHLFVYSGLVTWTFFATAITQAGNSVVTSERLITKVYFPRLAIPFASVGAAVVDFLIAFSLLIGLMLWYGILPGLNLLAAPAIFACVVLAALGVGTLLAALNVAYRDFRYVIPFLVQIWLFATPTIYLPDAVPSPAAGASGAGLLQSILALNPMTGLVAAFRAATLGGEMPWNDLAVSMATTLLMFVVGCLYFRKVEDNFADII